MVELVILFTPLAFKHGVTEADIRWAFKTKKLDSMLEDHGADGKYLLIGFDCNANLIELFYNVLDADTVRVFHAMKCRSWYCKLLNTQEKPCPI